MSKRVFICHSSQDHDFVIKLAKRLKKDSIDVWIDEWEIKVGDSITQKINEGLEDSSFFVMVFSKDSIDSEWAQRELNATLMRQTNKRDIKILPILIDIEPSQLPPLVQDLFSIKFSKNKINEANYAKLIEPIKNEQSADVLKNYQDVFFENAEHIDIILNKQTPTRQEVIFILDIIQDKKYENYFFRNVNSKCWFAILKNKDYFSHDKAPGPEELDQEGYYNIPVWNVLPYLERVSEQVNIPGNEIYIDELLKIIKNVSNYRDANGQHIDNYRTWWYFVKILVNIPNDKIPLEIIDLIPTWLDSKFDITLPGSDIATTLLPKFLPDAPTAEDIQKAERIIDYIFPIKWVKLPERLKGGISRKEEEPETIIDKFWLKESFITQEIAIQVGEKCSEKPIYLVADKLKEIFRHLHPTQSLDIELEDKIYSISVSQGKDFEFNCSVGLIEKDQLKTDKPGEELLRRLSVEPEELFKFEIRECKNNECFMEKIKTEISRSDIAREIEQELEEKIRYFYGYVFSDYSYIWFKSIAEGTGLTVHGTKETLTLFLKDILLAKAKKDKLTAQNIFKEFLGDKYQYPLFKRLVLFVIGECWNDFREGFWKLLEAQYGEQLFDDTNHEAEIYTLLEKNTGRFKPQEKERLKEVIEKGPQRYLPEDNKDKYVSYWKQKWYSALKADPDFNELYTRYKDKTQIKEEIPFKQDSVRVGPGPSPLTKEELLRMTNQELAEFLATFKTSDPWRGPTVGGLSETLKRTVQEQPEKFISELSPFLNTAYFYISNILWGVRDAWDNKKNIEWDKLLYFIKQYIDRDAFWQDKFKMDDDHWNAGHEWVVGMVGELIQEGTKNDNWAFAEDYFPAAQELIFIIIDNLKMKEEREIRDPVTHALNSAFGKTITALIYLALRIARLEAKKGEKKEVKWLDALKSQYEKVFNNGVIEAYTLFGQYMPNLYYLDKSWVEQKIEEFEGIEKEHLWSAFMYGYLFSSRFYDHLYKLMREHFLRAISYPFKEKHAGEGFVQSIAIGYLRGIEDLSENSLFGMLLNRWNYSHIKEIIGIFWTERDYLVKSIEKNGPDSGSDGNEKLNKIIDFWKWLYGKYKKEEFLNENDKKILSAVSKLAVFLPKIDTENIEWLMLSAPYVHLDFNSPFFIKYLDGLKDKGDKIESAKYIGSIFLKMLDVFTPDYDQKHIRSIVEYLYQVKDKETINLANKICDTYGSKGLGFLLRDIYEKNKYQAGNR